MFAKSYRPHGLLIATLILLAGSFVACSSTGDTVVDGDLEGDSIFECYTLIDCPPGEICEAHRCVAVGPQGDEDEVSDGDVELDADPDLEPVDPCGGCLDGQICNEQSGKCETPIDGDEEIEEMEGGEDEEMDDETPPVISVRFVQPEADAVVDSAVLIRLAIDTLEQYDTIRLHAAGSLLQEFTEPPYETLWDTSAIEEGEALLVVEVLGNERLLATATRLVYVDHSDPTLTLTSPESGDEFGYDQQIQVEADVQDHLQQVEFYIDDELQTTITEFDASGKVTINTPAQDLLPGDHVLMLRAKDRVDGHRQVEDDVIIHIDTEAPQLVLGGVAWSEEDPDEGVIFAETPMEIRFEDLSNLKQAYFELKDNFNHTLIKLTSTDEFPYTITDFDVLLPSGSQIYPFEVHVIANATDQYDHQQGFNRQLTIKREKMVFDTEVEPPLGYEQTYALAASETNGAIYATVYDQLISITTEGVERWRCQAETLTSFVSAPIVVEGGNQRLMVLTVGSDGSLYVRHDGQLEAECLRFDFDLGLSEAGAPAVGELEEIEGGVRLPVYSCATAGTRTKCFRTYYTHLDDAEAQNRDSFDIDWTFIGDVDETGPTAIVLPKGGSYTWLTVGMGRQVVSLDSETGIRKNVDRFNIGQKVSMITANPLGKGLMAASAKEFHLYNWLLTELNVVNFGSQTLDEFMPYQIVSDSEGSIMLCSKKDFGTVGSPNVKGVVTPIRISNGDLDENLPDMVLEGKVGATPVIGQENIVYVGGENANGNLWAFDYYADTDNDERQLRWRMRLQTRLLAPLVISPAGDLLLIDNELKIRLIDAKGDSVDAEASWPMYQATPQHGGNYLPQ